MIGTNHRTHGKLLGRRWRSIIGLLLVIYIFLTVVYLPQIYVGSPISSSSASHPVVQYVVANLLWFLITVLIIWLSTRFSLTHPISPRNIAIHLLLAVFLSCLYTIVYYSLLGMVEGVGLSHMYRITNDRFLYVKYTTNSFVFYLGILLLTEAIFYYQLFADRELRLQQAELDMMKAQLHPHFLFNTLNAISALVYISPKEATRTISQLSDLLRAALQANNSREVALDEELDFLGKYIEIQRTLLKDRLRVNLAIDPGTKRALVPNMILQPLVENSIQHGIAKTEDGGWIEITSRETGGQLLLQIDDSGAGSPESGEIGAGGIGLKNTGARLRQHYGRNQEYASGPRVDGGWRVTIRIPFRTAPGTFPDAGD